MSDSPTDKKDEAKEPDKADESKEEPLRAELRAFAESVRTRRPPTVDGAAGRRALELADCVTAGILDHARRVQPDAFAAEEVR